MKRILMAAVLAVSHLPAYASASDTAPARQPADDVIATVGDQNIAFSKLNTTLNSSAVVGLSIPALGSPERSQVVITLLDKMISANLLYLDARKKAVDQRPNYQAEIQRYEEGILASMYKSRQLIGEIPVSEKEISDYVTTMTKPEGDSVDPRMVAESKLRKQKLQKLKDTARERLRAGEKVHIDSQVLNQFKDKDRKDTDVVASMADQRVTWGEVKSMMKSASQRASMAEFYIDSDEERENRLNQILDLRLMARKARELGMDQEPHFQSRLQEFSKNRLINVHRRSLVEGWQPSEEQLKAYFEANEKRISVPEARKIQMVVLKTKEEAEAIKARIEAGEITIYQAARDHSVDPNAKRTLGEMGWVARGTGFPELDEFTFFQEPDKLGGPVQSPAGWHLVKVLDVRDAQYQYLEGSATRKKTLRNYIKDKLDAYVVDLRMNHFEVMVDDQKLTELFQKEADWIAGLKAKSEAEGSVTKERVQDLQKWVGTPSN